MSLFSFFIVFIQLFFFACTPIPQPSPDDVHTVDQNQASEPPVLLAIAKSDVEVELNVVSSSLLKIDIERSEGTSNSFSPLTLLPSGIKTYADKTVKAQTAYSYRARVEGSSAWSSITQVTTPQAPLLAPDKPAALLAKVINHESIEITLPSYDPKTQSRKLEVLNMANQVMAFVNVPLTVSVYVARNGVDALVIPPATSFRFRLFHVNAKGDSPASDPVTATTMNLPLVAPAAPTNFVATVMGNDVRFTWAINATATNAPTTYEFQRRKLGGTFAAITITQLNLMDRTAVDAFANHENGVSYDYRVRAVNTAGASAYVESNLIEFPLPPVTAPLQPTGLKAEKVPGKAEIKLSWVAQSDKATITSLQVYRRLQAGGSFALHMTSTTAYSLQSLVDTTSIAYNTAYCYKITVINTMRAESDFVMPEACATTDPLPIAAPVIDNILTLSPDFARIDYFPVAGATFYEIWMATGATCNDNNILQSWTVVTTTSSTSNQLRIGTLAAGDVFCGTVRASNGTIYSPFATKVVSIK